MQAYYVELSLPARIALERAFMEQSGLHGLDLQQANEGEGFYLVSTQQAYETWAASILPLASR